MMPPQPYPGMYYQPMTPEHMLSRRNVWFVNVLGLVMIWLALILRLVSLDPNLLKFDIFLIVTGVVLAALVNVAAALGSKKTTDMQNLGLFIWSGFLIAFAASVLVGVL
jgi:hypothetical protein